MLHKVSYEKDTEIISIKYWEIITISDLQDASKAAAQLIIDHKCNRILIDSREVDFQLSTLEIYNLPETFSSILSEFGLNLKNKIRAFIIAQPTEAYKFVETVALNQGY